MIELQDVVVRFDDKIILDHVNLTINEGETFVILGGSGMGKSTILRLIIGLQKPTSGNILVNGKNITDMNENQLNDIRKSMGMVFQYSALFDSMSVGENVAFGLKQHTDLKNDEVETVVKHSLRRVGLGDTVTLMPNELSGGMKKRVSLARAIALNPQIILYDEPTSGLDPISSGSIGRLIINMQKHLHCTSVVVTHDMQSAFLVGDRLALLDAGKFVEVSEKEIFKNSKNLKVQQFIHGDKKFHFPQTNIREDRKDDTVETEGRNTNLDTEDNTMTEANGVRPNAIHHVGKGK